ncbi:transporter [Methylovirgula sp. HY1]|uniref:SphA family protein n=1 Tax=Methylovirgula sp. HY1 TaxID=2822761 RepID=UPI001C5B6581|nr:transporter [Methylovirgula sp. HY1]QXX73274.1 hypothetical protein MHY1_00069 [Methylovirgula sp. HY1]
MPTLWSSGAWRRVRATLKASLLFGTAFISTASPVCAFEPGSTFMLLPGMTMGVPYAYFGSPGIYMNNFASYGTNTVPRAVAPGHGDIHVDATIDLVSLRWTTPWTLFGGTYGVAVIQPVVTQSQYGEIPGKGAITPTDVGGIHDTIVTPGMLSWQFPQRLFVAAGLRIGVPDGTIQGINGLSNIGAPYWMIQPTFDIAYLNDGWNIDANFFYDFYTTNPYSTVSNGQVFRADLAAAHKFGRFEIGPVGYLAIQTTKDTGGNTAGYLATKGAINTCEPLPNGAFNGCARAAKAGVGGKIGYDFGVAQINLLLTDSVLSRGVGGANGWRVWTQAMFKLYNETPAAPAVVAPIPD